MADDKIEWKREYDPEMGVTFQWRDGNRYADVYRIGGQWQMEHNDGFIDLGDAPTREATAAATPVLKDWIKEQRIEQDWSAIDDLAVGW